MNAWFFQMIRCFHWIEEHKTTHHENLVQIKCGFAKAIVLTVKRKWPTDSEDVKISEHLTKYSTFIRSKYYRLHQDQLTASQFLWIVDGRVRMIARCPFRLEEEQRRTYRFESKFKLHSNQIRFIRSRYRFHFNSSPEHNLLCRWKHKPFWNIAFDTITFLVQQRV